MNSLGAITCGVGLQDGLNPCIFMSCAVFILYSFSLASRPWKLVMFQIVFMLVYALGLAIDDFGPGQVIVFQKYFIFLAKCLYLVLGVGAFIFFIVFIKDWFLLNRQQLTEDRTGEYPPQNGFFVFWAAVILALILSAAATLWPINTYLMLLGSETLIKGQWHLVIGLLGAYVFFCMWPLWIVWAFISIKRLRPSLLKIFCASIFLTASMTMIFIFK